MWSESTVRRQSIESCAVRRRLCDERQHACSSTDMLDLATLKDKKPPVTISAANTLADGSTYASIRPSKGNGRHCYRPTATSMPVSARTVTSRLRSLAAGYWAGNNQHWPHWERQNYSARRSRHRHPIAISTPRGRATTPATWPRSGCPDMALPPTHPATCSSPPATPGSAMRGSVSTGQEHHRYRGHHGQVSARSE